MSKVHVRDRLPWTEATYRPLSAPSGDSAPCEAVWGEDSITQRLLDLARTGFAFTRSHTVPRPDAHRVTLTLTHNEFPAPFSVDAIATTELGALQLAALRIGIPVRKPVGRLPVDKATGLVTDYPVPASAAFVQAIRATLLQYAGESDEVVAARILDRNVGHLLDLPGPSLRVVYDQLMEAELGGRGGGPHRRLTAGEAAHLHRTLGAKGIKNHTAWASKTLGGRVASFTMLDTSEATQLLEAVKIT